jgi:hypothetical protein
MMLSKFLARLSRFFDPSGLPNRETPLVEVSHPVLGPLRWSPDDEAWIGSYRDFGFSLGYEGQATPSEPLISYALEVMDDPGWLDATFSAARDEAIRSFEAYYTEEIRSLTLGTIHFRRSRGTLGILADVEGGRNYRCWRIEYQDRHCFGIGFDD